MLKYILQFYLTIAIPLLYLLILLIMSQSIGSMSVLNILRIAGLIVSLIGLVIWISSYVSLGHSFGVLPKKQKKVTSGIYQYLPHPMYIGISSTFIGLSISLQSYPGLIITLVFLIPLLVIRAIFEERALKK